MKKRGKIMDNLKRIITALICLPILALILIFGNKYIIDVLFAIVAVISLYEYFHATSKEYKSLKVLGYLFAICIAFIHVIPKEILTKAFVMIIPTSICVLFASVIATEMRIKPKDIFSEFFGMCYILGFIIFLPLIYALENGKFFIWFVLIAAWGTDTFAYSIGRRIGKHKLTKISPKKSVEGSIAGIFGAIILGVIYTYFINKYVGLNISYLLISIMMFISSILSQLGDLAASSIKREMEIKDYGNLFPGHGGMIDRIDSIIFVAPFIYFLLIL